MLCNSLRSCPEASWAQFHGSPILPSFSCPALSSSVQAAETEVWLGSFSNKPISHSRRRWTFKIEAQ